MEGGGADMEVQDGGRSQEAVGRVSSDVQEAILARKQRQWEIKVQIPGHVGGRVADPFPEGGPWTGTGPLALGSAGLRRAQCNV